jgi:hypothetical protein
MSLYDDTCNNGGDSVTVDSNQEHRPRPASHWDGQPWHPSHRPRPRRSHRSLRTGYDSHYFQNACTNPHRNRQANRPHHSQAGCYLFVRTTDTPSSTLRRSRVGDRGFHEDELPSRWSGRWRLQRPQEGVFAFPGPRIRGRVTRGRRQKQCVSNVN